MKATTKVERTSKTTIAAIIYTRAPCLDRACRGRAEILVHYSWRAHAAAREPFQSQTPMLLHRALRRQAHRQEAATRPQSRSLRHRLTWQDPGCGPYLQV